MFRGGTIRGRARRRRTITATLVVAAALTTGRFDALLTRQLSASAAQADPVRVRVGVAGARPTATRPARLFRVARTPDGRLTVERTSAARFAKGAQATAAGWEPDSVVQAAADPYEPRQWALGASGFPTAWPLSTGAGVIVGVVDSGVRKTHADLAGSVLPGTDFVTGSGDGSNDQNGHGTHVAAIIAARRNGVGVVGGAPSARILPVRVLDANGSGYTSDVAQGIIWATDRGARVINLSLGGPQPSVALQQAMQYARSKGAVIVAAAGNNAQAGNPVMYPGAYPEAIAVAAVDNAYQRAPFSEMRSYVDVAAPGVSILSAWGSSDSAYAYASGTSMATPYVSATAALMLSQRPQLTPDQVQARIEATALDLGPKGKDPAFGAGLVEPGAALVRPVGTEGAGYWVVGANGQVTAFGGARFYGDLRGSWVFSSTVAAAGTKSGKGYWLATADGRVVPFGDARWFGDMAGRPLNGAIVAMAVTASGRGYWLMGRDGGIFTFGDARFFGSTGNLRLSAPAVDLAPTPDGRGYWFVASDGGVFSFGRARFKGSTGGLRLWQPVTSMAASANGRGYWLVARDGGIFAFGVPFRGSLAAQGSGSGLRIRAVPSAQGYYILTTDGAVHAFGTARYSGGARGRLPGGTPAVDLILAG